jgi:hypothetical protein
VETCSLKTSLPPLPRGRTHTALPPFVSRGLPMQKRWTATGVADAGWLGVAASCMGPGGFVAPSSTESAVVGEDALASAFHALQNTAFFCNRCSADQQGFCDAPTLPQPPRPDYSGRTQNSVHQSVSQSDTSTSRNTSIRFAWPGLASARPHTPFHS